MYFERIITIHVFQIKLLTSCGLHCVIQPRKTVFWAKPTPKESRLCSAPQLYVFLSYSGLFWNLFAQECPFSHTGLW